MSRRTILTSAGIGMTAAGLAACVNTSGTGATGGTGGGGSGDGIVFQNSIQDTAPKAALEQLVADYDGPVTMNSVATEQYRAQLTNYLRSSNPPDVYSWYAGSVSRAYASQGLLLDVAPLWDEGGACSDFSPALRSLSDNGDGTFSFVPTNYYWWSIFYKKSAFATWGITPPETWDEFIALCESLLAQGIIPLANGIGSTPWMASGWFDYLNLRLNGAQYHRELLAGEHAFTDPEVKTVMTEYARLIPFFDPDMASYSNQEATTPLVQDRAAMYLVGAFVTNNVPADMVEDLDFFSVPVIDPSIPTAEEAPTDGFFAASGSSDPEATLDFLSYLAAPEQQQRFIELSGSANLPTSPQVDTSGFSALTQKGIELLNSTEEITQFFNRDSSDALQTTADAALTRFLAQPEDVDAVLTEWQAAAEQVWSS
ncbi:ABC transporter substrate-binding protein [Brachybacterium phenoliresistens]|uniref:ABC transporter substrate-binding protein n=1 Tax=Brachybacterium phenoliresistens TaxID=396014 RepID=UPI0031D9F77F